MYAVKYCLYSDNLQTVHNDVFQVKILMDRVYDIHQSDYGNPTQSSISVHLSWSSSSFTAIPPDYADAVVVRISFHIC